MMEPVVREVTVPVEPERAFHRFTAELGTWWPRRTHSLGGEACAATGMEAGLGGRLYEVAADGSEQEWGRVTEWAPPERVAFTWHVGRSPALAQRVIVTFAAVAAGTHVRLEHHDWEMLGAEAAEVRAQYDGGWTHVLGLYAGSLAEVAARR